MLSVTLDRIRSQWSQAYSERLWVSAWDNMCLVDEMAVGATVAGAKAVDEMEAGDSGG